MALSATKLSKNQSRSLPSVSASVNAFLVVPDCMPDIYNMAMKVFDLYMVVLNNCNKYIHDPSTYYAVFEMFVEKLFCGCGWCKI